MWHLAMREVGPTEPHEFRFETSRDSVSELQQFLNSSVEELWVPRGMSLQEGLVYEPPQL